MVYPGAHFGSKMKSTKGLTWESPRERVKDSKKKEQVVKNAACQCQGFPAFA